MRALVATIKVPAGWVRWGGGGHDLAGGGRQALMLESAPFKRVGGRNSRWRGLEEAWAGALSGLERRRRCIDLW